MLVIGNLEANKTDLVTIEDSELRKVCGGVGLGGLFGTGIGFNTIYASSIELRPLGGGGNIANILPNPLISPSSLVKTAGLKF